MHLDALKTYEEKGNISSVLEEQPSIPSANIWLWEAFWELSATRKEITNISYVEVLAYCQLKGLQDMEDIDMLLATIQALDPLWVEWANAKVKENA